MLAEAQMLRDRAMSHYHARSLFGSNHRHDNRRNGLGFDRQTVTDRGFGVTLGHKASSTIAESLKMKDIEGDPLFDTDALKALVRLLRMAQVTGQLVIYLFLSLMLTHTTYKINFYFSVSATWERPSAETLIELVCS